MATRSHPGEAPYRRLTGLATATGLLLGLDGLIQVLAVVDRLTGRDPSSLDVPELAALVATMPVFATWFYLAYRNSARWTGERRFGPGWAVAAWIVPFLNCWRPYQILAETWRASQPAADGRRGPDAVARAWWACWLLALATGFHLHGTVRMHSLDGSTQETTMTGVVLGSTTPSSLFAAAAAGLAIITVSRVTGMQEARLREARLA